MKKRAAFLALLLALSVPLIPLMGSPSKGSEARPTQDAAGLTNPDAATEAPARDPSAIGPAVFPHDEHAEDMEIECVECHHETSAAPLSFPHKDYFDDFWIDCTICHHESGAVALTPQGCSKCHHSPNGDIADETLSAKVVIHKNCWSCHDVGTGVEASSTCKDCHVDGR